MCRCLQNGRAYDHNLTHTHNSKQMPHFYHDNKYDFHMNCVSLPKVEKGDNDKNTQLTTADKYTELKPERYKDTKIQGDRIDSVERTKRTIRKYVQLY